MSRLSKSGHHSVCTHTRQWDSKSQKWGGQATILFYRGDPEILEKGKSISIDEYGERVELNDKPLYIEPVQGFGRIQGAYVFAAVLSLTAGRTDYSTFDFPADNIARYRETLLDQEKKTGRVFYKLAGETSYDNDVKAIVLESSLDDKITERYWIDPERGYICPLVQIFNPTNGFIIEEYKSTDFFQHFESGLWYPEHFTRNTYDPSSGKLKMRTEHTVDKNSFRLNHPVSNEEFSLDVAVRERIVDARNDQRVLYRAIKDGILSLHNINLSEQDFLHLGSDMPPIILNKEQTKNKEIKEIIQTREEELLKNKKATEEELRQQWQRKHIIINETNNEGHVPAGNFSGLHWRRIILFFFLE